MEELMKLKYCPDCSHPWSFCRCDWTMFDCPISGGGCSPKKFSFGWAVDCDGCEDTHLYSKPEDSEEKIIKKWNDLILKNNAQLNKSSISEFPKLP